MRFVYFALFAIIIYLIVVFVVNRFAGRKPRVALAPQRTPSRHAVPRNRTLEVISWNLGYAGLGENANFVADGGVDWLPGSKSEVRDNVSGIAEALKSFDADVYLFQELAGPSVMNRHIDLRKRVIECLSGYQYVYSADLRTRLIPRRLGIDIGTAVFSRHKISESAGLLLPQERHCAGFIRKNYRMVVCRFNLPATSHQLIVVNVHLAAFDKEASVRLKQLKKVKSFMERQHDLGHYVIVGGDWNLRLAETDFPHTTSEKYLFWLADFPTDVLSDGWEIVADEHAPSVRTVHKAYTAGDNYTCVIDGFIVSPNVKALEVENLDLGFRHADHNPVRARFVLDAD